MCLIIASQSGRLPDNELVAYAAKQNPHGWGLMWADNGVVRNVKGFRTDSLQRNLDKLAGIPFCFHVRWATHGSISIANCHPFRITDDLWMMHNGIFTISTPRKDRSDTWHFALELKAALKRYPMLRERENMGILMQYATARAGGSRITFMRGDGSISIVNEDAGAEYEGCWLSNENCLYDNYADRWNHKKITAQTSMFCADSAHSKYDIVNSPNDGESIAFDTLQNCDWCDERFLKLSAFENQLLCADCYEFVVRECQMYDDDRRDFFRGHIHSLPQPSSYVDDSVYDFPRADMSVYDAAIPF